VLHWADGGDGRGALLSGDIVQVAMDVSRVSFLWSYPNMMPLAAATVRRIADKLTPWRFDRIYGAFPGRQVMTGGAHAVQRSAARYIALLEGSQASLPGRLDLLSKGSPGPRPASASLVDAKFIARS